MLPNMFFHWLHYKTGETNGINCGKQVGFWSLLWLTLINAMDCSISRIDLQQTYRQEVTEKDASERPAHKSTKLEMLLWQYLYVVHPMTKLGNHAVMVISKSIENIPDWRPMHAAQAFRHIEQFALNLIDYPWRKEYRTIKLFTGFWKLKIDRHLFEPLPLFTKMGYQLEGEWYLQLKNTASRDQLIEVATDCYIAAAELQFYEEIHLLIDHQGFSLKDVHTCRTSVSGDKQNCIDWISSNCKPSFKKIQESFEKVNSDIVEPDKNGTRRLSRRDSDLSGYSFPPPPPSTIMSVDSGALPAEDEVDHDPRDSGYVSKPNTGEHPLKKMEVGKMVTNNRNNQSSSKIPTENSSGSTRSFAIEAAAFTAVENEYTEPVNSQTTPSPRNASLEDDLYAPRTMEDHLRHSLKLVSEKSEKFSPTTAGPPTPSSAGGSSEWDHVTKGLKEKFGEEYYAGLRGDILKQGPRGNGKTADVIVAKSKTSSPMSAAGKGFAGIHKGVGKKGSPQSPSTPVTMQPCAMQYQAATATTIKELYNQTTLEADGSQSPEILQPPKSYPTLLDTGYHAPNFSTFGVDNHTLEISKHKSDANEKDKSHTRAASQDYTPDLFGLDPTGYDNVARRLYQADSNQSLNKDNYIPVPSSFSAPTTSASTQQALQQQDDAFAVYAKPNKMGKRANQTEPILRSKPAKGPAPAVPTRRHTLPPTQWQCSDCTFANPASATVCEMCSKSHQKGAEQKGLTSGGSQCAKCTYVNKPGALICTVCHHTLSKSPTYI